METEQKKAKRPRRNFTDEFKAGAVALVLKEGKSVTRVAKELDLRPSSLSRWVEQARVDAGKSTRGTLTTEEKEELARLRKEVRELRLEREILKKRGGLLREGERVRFAFVAEKAEQGFARLCRALAVSPSGYYAWRRRPQSAHDLEDERLRVLVHEAHQRGRTYYGSPRVHRALVKQGVHVSRRRIIRLMQEEGLIGRAPRRFKCSTDSRHALPVAANLLDREFEAERPNQRWVGDTTELTTLTGKLYLAAILDLYSRFVVGWALSAVNDRHLTLKALDMALRRRCPGEGLMHHSDRGSPYASDDYQNVLTAHGITCSMSRAGNCLDNAAMESWNSTLKSELGERFEGPADTKAKLFDYIEVFYNQLRLHSSLGYVSPAEFERVAAFRSAA
ncbi:MAG: IS3 family transposase [Deltaproteobacteria bacterium]